jgi:hypothetical protein
MNYNRFFFETEKGPGYLSNFLKIKNVSQIIWQPFVVSGVLHTNVISDEHFIIILVVIHVFIK